MLPPLPSFKPINATPHINHSIIHSLTGDLNSDLFEKLYKAGARIMSMSWGSPDR